jgi:hypothetical protein
LISNRVSSPIYKVSIIRVCCWYFACLHRTIIWSVICVVIGWLVGRRITRVVSNNIISSVIPT